MTDKILGPLTIVLMGIIGLVSLANVNFAKALAPGIEDGQTQQRLESGFDKAVAVRSASISIWAAFRAAAFHEADVGAMIGRDLWLFTDEEYRSRADFEKRFETSVASIAEASDKISRAGSKLVVVLLPDKARIMSGMAPSGRSPKVDGRYDRMMSRLTQAGVQVVDVRPALQALAASTTPPFLRSDTHWSVAGAKAVAEQVAPLVKQAVADRTEFVLATGETKPRTGDLADFLPTGVFARWLGPVEDEVAPVSAAKSSSSDLLGDAPPAKAMLVGTSYSAKEELGFLPYLMAASGTDIINRSAEGQGPFAPMKRVLQEERISDFSIVVWEIPERYLTLEMKGE